MAIPIECPACKKTAEHEERWRGCLRPCPTCGEKVLVPDDPRLVEKPIPIEPVCFCGACQQGPEEGLWYRVTFRHREEASEWGGRYLDFGLLLAFGPFITLLARFGRASTEAVVRWACPSCQGQVVRASRWGIWGALFVFLLFIAIPWGGMGWILIPLAAEELHKAHPQWRRWVALAAICGPIAAWIAWRLGRRILAWGFTSANAGYTSLLPLYDAASPVHLQPDGEYVFTPRERP